MRIGRVTRALVPWVLLALLGGTVALARAEDAPSAPPPPNAENPLGGWLAKRKPVPAPAWRDASIVERRFAEALDAVEAECGAKFATRPTVRISTKSEVEKVVRAELAALPKSLGAGDVSPFFLEALLGALNAKYDVEAHVVHVVPENVEQCAGLTGLDLGSEDVLRVALAHECTHALDFPRFRWAEARRAVSSELELKALGAIVEGHAQVVAKRIAARWDLAKAFETLTRGIDAVPEDMPEFVRPLLRAASAEVSFGYVQGAAFLEAVGAEAGKDGVQRALEHPPKTTREIEHPAEWLHPERLTKGLDLTPALEALEPLVPSPAWNVRTADLLEATLRSQMDGLPPDEVKAAFEAFQSAKVLVANRVGASDMFIVLGMGFSTEAGAKAFAVLDRHASEAKDAKMKTGPLQVRSARYLDGAGSGGKLSGCSISKVLTVGPQSLSTTASIMASGPFAFEVVLSGREVERAWMDRVVDALAAFVTDPAHPLPSMPADAALQSAEEPALPDLEHRTTVEMTLVGPGGKPVARARIEVAYERAHASFGLSCTFRDGKVDLPAEASRPLMLIHGAADERGEPLDFGPLLVEQVDLTAKGLRFELPPGHAVQGRVVDAAGRGVSGVSVRAASVEGGRPGGPHLTSEVIASATTDADGRYRLRGLGPRTRISVHPPKPLTGPAPVAVEGDGPAPDLVVAQGHSSVVTVLDPDGGPVVGAAVQWGPVLRTDTGSTTEMTGPEARTDGSGRATLEGLPHEGLLGLFVRPPPGARDLGRYTAWSWDGRDLEVRLKRVQRVHGRVVDDKGKAATDATVHVRAGDSRYTLDVGSDGTFSLDDVEVGTVLVGATRGSRGEFRDPPRWIKVTSDEPVEIVVGAAPVLFAITFRGLAAGREAYVRKSGAEESFRELKAAEGGIVRVPEVEVGGRLDVYIEPTADDPRGLAAPGVLCSADGVTLELVACVASKGAVRAGTEYTHLEVYVIAPWRMFPIEVAADGTFVTPRLPPGKYELRAKARGTESWIYARAEFEAGAALDMELRPK